MDSDLAHSILDTFPDADLSIVEEVLFFDGWQSYDECGGFLIFRGIDGSIQRCEYGYSVMASDNTNWFQPMDISEDEYHRTVADMASAASTIQC